jgi:hypothetical protein
MISFNEYFTLRSEITCFVIEEKCDLGDLA